MAYLAVNEGVFSPQHIGALLKCSAGDLVACVIHNIETAWALRKKASLLTMDIQGAFDAVLKNRLCMRLREQGWPTSLCAWALSFATDRTASIRLGDETQPNASLASGLPQGSPASPVLFALFIAPLLRLGFSAGKFGYADDIALLRTGKSLDITTAALAQDATEVIEWGRQNELAFDPAKCDLIHLDRGRGATKRSVWVTTTSHPAQSYGG